MVSLIRQIGGDTDGEVDVQHRRIQRMLEETLTKNMHLQVCHFCILSQIRIIFAFFFFLLQEDIERLSQEVVRLSQIVGSANIVLPPTESSDREAATASS
jgi:hypothetical protein